MKIPAGVDNGAQMRLTGEGEVGANGGPRGNLYLQLNVKQHEVFRRDEDDILLDLDLNFAQVGARRRSRGADDRRRAAGAARPGGHADAASCSSSRGAACRTCAAAAAAT